MSAERILWWLAIACAAAVIVFSFAPRTSRTYGERGSQPFTIATESAARWQIPSILLGTVALGALESARRARPRVAASAIGALVAAFAFCWVAVRVGQYWVPIIQEQAQQKEYVLRPSGGLPLVFVSAVIGAGYAFALSPVWFLTNFLGSSASESGQPSRRE